MMTSISRFVRNTGCSDSLLARRDSYESSRFRKPAQTSHILATLPPRRRGDLLRSARITDGGQFLPIGGNPGSAKSSFFQRLISVLCGEFIPLATADQVPAAPNLPLDRCPDRLHRKNRQQFRETKKLFPKKRSTCDFLSLLWLLAPVNTRKSNKNLHHYKHTRTAYSDCHFSRATGFFLPVSRPPPNANTHTRTSSEKFLSPRKLTPKIRESSTPFTESAPRGTGAGSGERHCAAGS